MNQPPNDLYANFQVDFEKGYANFSVQLQRKGLQEARSPYYLWIYTIMVGKTQVDVGMFPWSITLERLSDEDVADMVSKEYAGSTLINKASRDY